MSERVELAKVLYKEGAYCGNCEYVGWDTCADCRRCCIGYAAAAMLAGFTKRAPVTEWAAGFPGHQYPYNYHRTREEAQAFVDGMKEVGADMVVMTREVLPQDASDWKRHE